MTRAFKATLFPALDIETFVISIRQKLDKLSCKSLLQIASSQLHKTIITQRPQPSDIKKISPLEIFSQHFEKCFNCKIKYLEQTIPFITPPWWMPPFTEIAPFKLEAKISHDNIIQTHNPQKQLIAYSNRSEINGKIGAAAVSSSQNITLKAFLGPKHLFTVYLGRASRACNGT